MNSSLRALTFALAGVLVILAACAPPPAQTAAVPDASASGDADLRAFVDSIAARAVAEGRVTGLAVGARHGDDVHIVTVGHADVAAGTPVTPGTVFRIGSVTKQFTAAGILRLADEGRIDLDAPIETYLPDYPTHGHTVTVRHLLNHTGGMPTYTTPGIMTDERVTQDYAPERIVALFAELPYVHEPGEGFFYNNSGYFLLGLITEAVTGRSWEAYLEEAFFDPLGLESTFYCPGEPGSRGQARGYRLEAGEPVVEDSISMTWPYAAGALCSTAEDLLRWDRALHGGELLTPAAYAAMTTPHLPENAPLRYGYGVMVDEVDGRARIHHGGGIHGFVSQLARFPDDDVSVVVLTNTSGPTAYTVEQAVSNRMLGIAEPEVREGVELSAAEMEVYAGIYRTQAFRVRVFVEDGVLMSHALAPGQEPFPLVPQGDHRFFADLPTPLHVTFHVEGDVATHLEGRQGATRLSGPRIDEDEAPAEEVPLTADERARLIGRYDIGILEIDVFEQDGVLMARATGQQAFAIRHLGGGVFGSEFDDTLRLEFDPEGERAEGLVLTQQGMRFEGSRVD